MEQSNKAVVSRFLEETEERNREAAYDQLCTEDYVEHDPAMPEESVGLAEAARVYRELIAAFGLRHTAASMVAEGDLACARFIVRGRHTGEYRGLPPSGRSFESTGHVTLRFHGEKIAETWFNWDVQGAMEQLGGPEPPAL
jgi:predicted ester cyclase